MMTELQIPLCPDAKGYLDRECHNPDCLYTFKIMMEDWKNKVSDKAVYCPMCGHTAVADQWATREQISIAKKRAQEWAQNLMQNMLSDMCRQLETSTRGNKYIKITYKQGRKISFRNNPIGQREEWENEITCEKCGTRYSVIGSAYFCPCCGYNSVENEFSNSINSISNMLNSLPGINLQLEKSSKDIASDICRKLLEDSLGDIVSAFQKFACARYETLSGNKRKPNDFQRINDGSNLFEAISGCRYNKWLSVEELKFMQMQFQRRHCLQHCGGIVDQQYIDRSEDQSYQIGQRLVVHDEDARNLLAIVRKLGEGLKQLEKHQGE